MRRALLLRSEVRGVERNAENPGSVFSDLSVLVPVPVPKRPFGPAEGMGIALPGVGSTKDSGRYL